MYTATTNASFTLKAPSHGVMCDCDLLYQEMESCLRFSDFVHKVRWVWMRFPMYLHWNHTSQSHRMGVVPNRVWHHTHQCIARTWNRTIWTPSLTSIQSIFCIAVANKKNAPCERALKVHSHLRFIRCELISSPNRNNDYTIHYWTFHSTQEYVITVLSIQYNP